MDICVESIAPEKACSGPEARVEYSKRSPSAASWAGCATVEESRSLRRWLRWNERRGSGKTTLVVHVHGDAFFASVEKILIPKLSGKAVLIGRDLVWSASDEAKLRGVKIGMSLRDALRICPKAVVVAGEHERYAGFADRVRRVLESFTAAVEISALGGFYLNCAETGGVDSNFEATLRRLQKEILERTGLSVSIGAGRSKVLALVASQLERPRGLRVVEPDAEETFLAALPVETLRGVGDIEPVILKEHGVSTIGQLRLLPKPVLVSVFGEAIGLQLWNAGRGRDLVPPRRKAVWQAVFAVAKLWAFGNPARLERRMAAS